MADDNEFGEFSSVSEGWSEHNNVTTSFDPDWLAYPDSQDWTASGVIPNNEHPWNASFPELPKELSNLLSDEMTSLGDSDALPFTIANLPTNGSGHEFGDFEFSLDNPEVVMTTNNPITDINVPISTQNNLNTSKSQPVGMGGVTEGIIVDEDDEFGDFEGPSIPKQPGMVQAANVSVSEVQDEAEDEFGGFVSTTTTEVKEKVAAVDDFGSFEAAEFVVASSFPPLQAAQHTPSTVGAPPTDKLPPTFTAVAENCFHCDQSDPPSTDHESLNTLAEQSSLWLSLQSGLKTTSPLYSWSKSHVEDQYFAALRVDPMLVYTILSFAEEMGMAPLAPHDQLLADEGFQWPDSPTEERPQEVAATLLDLTLSSPVPPAAASAKAMSRHGNEESFTLDADLMGLDFTLTDDPQLTTMVGEGLPDPVMIEASNSKTADAIADILGLTTNPYLTSRDDNQLIGKDDNNDQLTSEEDDKNNELTSKDNQSACRDTDNALFTTGAFTSNTSEPSPAVANTSSLSQPLESLVVSKDELQLLMPSQETLDALKVAPTTLQSLAEADDKPPATSDNDQPASLSNAALDLLSSLPVLPESSHPLALSNAAHNLLTSLPDVTFMLSNTHTKHT